MKRINSALFLATVASMALASGAQAQEIHGTGATSVQNVLVQEMNCIGGYNDLGLPSPNPDGSFSPITEPTISTPAGAFNCASSELLNGSQGKYIGTGSGFGRQAWSNNSNQFWDKVALTGTKDVNNPFVNINGDAVWDKVHFAFSDSSATAADITAHDANVGAGAGIMVPKYVLPVAFAYNPVYGKKGSTEYRFNVTSPQSLNNLAGSAVNVGGLPLTRILYCGIFNGDIKNWNDSRFATANGGNSLRDPQDEIDNPGRWAAQGAPVRIVGRLDRSGTTDIFTRSLAAQCSLSGITQHYTTNSETLPYNSTSGVNFVNERSDTGLRPGGPTPAGTTNLVGKEWFNGSAIAVSTASLPGAPSSNPSAANGNGSGLFLVANGSGGIRDAVNYGPDFATTANPSVLLNGKIGYISSDYIANSPTGSATLHAAALSRPSAPAMFILPSSAAASTALGTIAPPESDSAGAFANFGTTANPRSNPLSWYNVMYPSLANPTSGYPVTGTTQMLLSTCYASGNMATIKNLLGWNTNDLTHDWTGADRTAIFTTNLLGASNIGAVPASWQRAVNQTFLHDSAEVSNGQRLGALNLWIEANGSAHCAGKSGL